MNSISRKATIFIIDDDQSVVTSLGRLLVLAGYDVGTFLSARMFLNSVPVDATGCLITDIYMPEIDGFVLQQKMMQLGYRLPVIFMSAHAKDQDRKNALEHGAAGFLLKPFSEQSVLDAINKVTV